MKSPEGFHIYSPGFQPGVGMWGGTRCNCEFDQGKTFPATEGSWLIMEWLNTYPLWSPSRQGAGSSFETRAFQMKVRQIRSLLVIKPFRNWNTVFYIIFFTPPCLGRGLGWVYQPVQQ